MSDKVRSERTADERPGDEAETSGSTGSELADEAEIPVEVDAADGDAGEGEAADAPAADLEAQVAELTRDKQDTYERLLRATADLDNFRKRAKRDVEDARIDARSRVLKEMLPVIDNLERALQHAEQNQPNDGGDTTGIIDGVKLVLRQFAQALERCDVTPIEAEGKPFDPNLHEAMGQRETDELPPGSVVQVLQRGYLIGDRLLRPALVMVAKAVPEQQIEGGNGRDPGNGSTPDADGSAGSSEEA